MNLILFESLNQHLNLRPLSLTRPISEFRVGILTLAEKWERTTKEKLSNLTAEYLSEKYPLKIQKNNILINAALCPSAELWQKIKNLKLGEGLVKNNVLLAYHIDDKNIYQKDIQSKLRLHYYENQTTLIENLWDIFLYNQSQIVSDINLLSLSLTNTEIKDPYTKIYNKKNIWVEPGAIVKAAILNAEEGPIFIDKGAHIHEGAIIKGPVAIGERAHINMGAKIRGATTIGPYSKVGGEVSNSVIFGYSNKAHDGFLGNSVIGEWCNLGADTNTSNLKNNYGEISIWNYHEEAFCSSQQQFCGLIMGDHSKSAINTMFNTGTVVGVNANIYHAGFPPRFIPSFSWGFPQNLQSYDIEKAIKVAQKVLARRKITIDDHMQSILRHVFDITRKYRTSLNIS